MHYINLKVQKIQQIDQEIYITCVHIKTNNYSGLKSVILIRIDHINLAH